MSQILDVEGFCPSCHQRTLHLMPSRMLYCLNNECEEPESAQRLLMAGQPEELPQLPIAVR